MAKRVVEESNLTELADVIRQKAALTDSLAFPEGFASAVEGLQIAGAPVPAVLTVTNSKSSTSYKYWYYTNGAAAWSDVATGAASSTLSLDLKVGDTIILLMQGSRSTSSTSTAYKAAYEITGGIGTMYSFSKSSSNTVYHYYFYFAVITEQNAGIRIYTP